VVIFGLLFLIAFSPIGDISHIAQAAEPSKSGSTECSTIASCIAGVVYWFTVGLGSGVAYLAAWVFSLATALSLSSTAYALDFITTGWTLMRDLANMFFVLILVYIALTIMFRANTHDTAKKLARVIVIALVINFSFFFTRVVIDAGNLLAVQFYNAIEAGPIGSSNASLPGSELLTWTGAGSKTKDLTASIMNGIGVQTILGNENFKAFQDQNTDLGGGVAEFLTLSFIYITVGAMLFMLAAAFFTVGIKFIIRIVVLWLLIIASPLAFVANTLQEGKKYYTQWQSALITHAFYPAFFLVIFYILTLFMEDLTNGGKDSILSQSFDGANIATTASDNYTYIISVMAQVLIRMGFVLALLFIGLKASEKMGVMGASLAQSATSRAGAALRWGGGMGLRATAASGAFAGRNTLGRAAYGDIASGRVAGWEARGGLWNNLRARGTKSLSKATFDVRNAPGGAKLNKGLSVLDRAMGVVGGSAGYSKITPGKGTTRNFEKLTEDKAKAIEAKAKVLKASEEEVRKAQEEFKVRYDAEPENGPGAYARRTAGLRDEVERARAKAAEYSHNAAIADTDFARKRAIELRKVEEDKMKKASANLQDLEGQGKKVADEKARQRIISFARRIGSTGLVRKASYGELQGAGKAMKLVAEKTAKEKFTEAAKAFADEEGKGDDGGGPDKPGGGKKPGSSDSKPTDASGSDKTGGGPGDGPTAHDDKVVTTLESVGDKLVHGLKRVEEKTERGFKISEQQLHTVAEALRARGHGIDPARSAKIQTSLKETRAHTAGQQPVPSAPRPIPQAAPTKEPGINDFPNFRKAQTETKGVSTPPPTKPEFTPPPAEDSSGDSIPKTGTHG